MANCGKDTNGSQFNFQEPCQWLIVVKILMGHSLIFRKLVNG